ncbi:MAG: PIN domain-containing protein [Actinomycetota bacterium]
MGEGVAGSARGCGSGRSALDRLILDTTILVSEERRGNVLDALIGDEDAVTIAEITAAELLVGVELADARRRCSRQRYVETLLSTVPVEGYDLEVVRAHAILLAHARRSGRTRGAHDLIIAATALARKRMVVTADESGFADLPGVLVRALA